MKQRAVCISGEVFGSGPEPTASWTEESTSIVPKRLRFFLNPHQRQNFRADFARPTGESSLPEERLSTAPSLEVRRRRQENARASAFTWAARPVAGSWLFAAAWAGFVVASSPLPRFLVVGDGASTSASRRLRRGPPLRLDSLHRRRRRDAGAVALSSRSFAMSPGNSGSRRVLAPPGPFFFDYTRRGLKAHPRRSRISRRPSSSRKQTTICKEQVLRWHAEECLQGRRSRDATRSSDLCPHNCLPQ